MLIPEHVYLVSYLNCAVYNLGHLPPLTFFRKFRGIDGYQGSFLDLRIPA